ncbi:MAG: hydrogenase formation protein HypD [bacterium]
MKYRDEFHDGALCKELSGRIIKLAGNRPLTFMEVCGTHTVSIHRFGIRSLLPGTVRLLSGPGCPVCVTSASDIDRAIALVTLPDVIVATFGDLFRVPGTFSSLAAERASGRDVRLLYSPLEALQTARENPGKTVVLIGVGFETTTPILAATVLEARKLKLENFTLMCAMKTIPEALETIIRTPELKVDGFLLPGHLSAVTGTAIYDFIPERYRLACAVTGFEPLDILMGVHSLVSQVVEGKCLIENAYGRAVPAEGNPKAVKVMQEVFEPCDAAWRGIGLIPRSGLRLRPEFADMDALRRFPLELPPAKEHPACLCGQILRGLKSPEDCPLFGRECLPENPVGACMVSSEGTCAAHFRYGGRG